MREPGHSSPEPKADSRAGAQEKRPQRRPWNRLLGWLLTLVLLVGIAWVVPLRDVWQALLGAKLFLLALALGPVLLNLWLRGVRWALLFRPHHEISGNAALGPVLIGMGLNAVVPGRVGDIARATLGARKFNTTLPFTASTIVGERMLDILILLIFLGGSLFLLPQVDTASTVHVLGYSLSAETLVSLGRKLGLVSMFLTSLALLLMSPAFHRVLLRLLGWLPGIGPRIEAWAEHVLREFGRGLTALRRPSILAQALLMSLVIWLALALTNLLVSKAIPGINLNFLQALVVTSISIGASFLPSAPGAWGVYEAGVLLALGLVQVVPEPSIGIAFAFASHLCAYLPIVVLSAIAGFQYGGFRNPTIDPSTSSHDTP